MQKIKRVEMGSEIPKVFGTMSSKAVLIKPYRHTYRLYKRRLSQAMRLNVKL
jgi:hypothetical protein